MSDGWTLAGAHGPRRAAVLLLAVAAAAGQPPRPQDPTGTEVEAAVERWLATDQVDESLLQKTVAIVLVRPAVGLPSLGRLLRPALATPGEKRSSGLRALALHTILGFVERARASGMTFRGQYSPLEHLQPVASEHLVQLLLRTPDWFPDTHRIRLVPALRDLQPTAPTEPALLGVIDLVQNTAIEPADLRLQLACLLWQWGRKEYVEPFLARMRRESAEGDAENRLVATRELADLYYQLGDYERASVTHVALQRLASSARVRLTPTDWYWAACCQTLAGDIERGFAALEQCAELQADESVDSSRKLPRTLFEQDPELARLRGDERFARVLGKAFPAATTGKDR